MRTTTAILIVSMLGSAGAANAGELPADHGGQGWAFQVTPYLWAAGLEGDISPFRRVPTLAVDKSFSDVLDHLNFGGFVDIWGRYDRYVFSGDLMYVNTTDSHAVGSLPMVGATPGLSADVDTAQFTATLKAGYRVYDDSDFTVDLLGGIRIWHVSNDLTVRYGGFSRSYGEDFGWVDPVVGFRTFYRVNPTCRSRHRPISVVLAPVQNTRGRLLRRRTMSSMIVCRFRPATRSSMSTMIPAGIFSTPR